MNSLRIFISALGFVSAFLAPPWVTFICIVLLALRWRAAEAIVIGLIVDLMWLPAGSFFETVPLFTLSSILLVWVLEPLRLEFLR